ncbi:MAG TPA: DUF4252 domain-containing protein [Terriglobales bacterium]|nr:DUF4252 domain-containing protein [Terriglobales bacterium]
MKTTKQFWLSIALQLLLACLAVPAFGQNAKLELKNLEKLSNKASEVNDITLDGAMLELAWKFMQADGDPEAAQLRDILKGLKGIYVKNFEFDGPNQYSQADVDAIRAQLTAPGWQRIVESRSQHSKEHDEIYIMKQGDAITGLAILVAEPNELTVVNIVGPIDINKLATLEGHFGIPGEHNGHIKHKTKAKSQEKSDSGKPQLQKREQPNDDDEEN